MTSLKLHLDTDLGGDIDDLCALAMALNWPGVELVGVTTNSEDQGRRAGYTRYALKLAGREDIPVAAGAEASLGYYRVWPVLPDESDYWPEAIQPAPARLDQALDLLEHSIRGGAIIAATGAFTNLALLEKRSPGILQDVRLTLMGGYIYPPRAGYPQWGNEMDWNVQVDTASAALVLQHAKPLLVTLSVTVETALRRAYLPALQRAGPLARLVARQAEAFARDEDMERRFGQTCPGLPADIINFLHDPLACAIALGWREGVEVREIPLSFEMKDGWLYERIDEGGKPTKVVVKADGKRFSEHWLKTVVRG